MIVLFVLGEFFFPIFLLLGEDVLELLDYLFGVSVGVKIVKGSLVDV